MESKDMGQLLSRAKEMQEQVVELQRQLALRSFEGSSGAGMVTAIATGELRIREVRIEPELLNGGDREMLQDLIAAAVNAALANAQQGAQEELQRLTGGLGIPGNPLNPLG